jgi:hypothetical protein
VQKGSKIFPLVAICLALLVFCASFVRWETVGSPLFSAGDFKDFRGFFKILDDPEAEAPENARQMSAFLASRLPKSHDGWQSMKTSDSKRVQGLLAEMLNNILSHEKLAEVPKDKLSDERQAELKKELPAECVEPPTATRIHLNRWYLDCAYPTWIRSYQSRASEFWDESNRPFLKVPHDVVVDVRYFIQSQIKTFMVLTLFALLPGIAGLIYRRAFWRWFLIAFAFLFLATWGFARMDWNYPGKEDADKLENPYGYYLWVEVFVLQLLIAFRLRRHSAVAVDARAKWYSIIPAVIIILVAIGWLYYRPFNFLEWGGVAISLLFACPILWQSLRTGQSETKFGKNIVVCLDGTWNEPGTSEYGHVTETNVLKLFKLLKGELKQGKRNKQYNSSQCKEHAHAGQGTMPVKQIAFYYHGVGNKMENSEIGQLFGGAFGMGAAAIVDRAYLDVAKVYRQGDRIFIFGFSRGAAIARLLASAIGHRSVPTSTWTFRLFGRSRSIWSSSHRVDDAHNPVKVDVLGCWDTVGSFGIAKNIFGIPFQQMNLLRDLTVALCVKRAWHLVALDETRDAFVPTLMEPDPTDPKRITEVWFSGSHANVGGGYATDQLSDLTLDFLLRRISSGYGGQPGDEAWGLYLNAVADGPNANSDEVAIRPDAKGPIRHSTGSMYSYAPRRLPVHAVIHDSVFERMRDTFPVYAPQSLFDLNRQLVAEWERTDREVTALMKTGSLSPDQCSEILEWSRKKLSLMKWSNLEPDHLPVPEQELKNPFSVEAVAQAVRPIQLNPTVVAEAVA